MSDVIRWVYLYENGDPTDTTAPGIYASVPDLLALLAVHDAETIRRGLQETLDQALAE